MWELTLSWSINCISTRSRRAYFLQIWMLKMKTLWVVIDGKLSKTWLLKRVKAFLVYTNRNTGGIDASGQDELTKTRFIFPPQITKSTEQNTWNNFFFQPLDDKQHRKVITEKEMTSPVAGRTAWRTFSGHSTGRGNPDKGWQSP